MSVNGITTGTSTDYSAYTSTAYTSTASGTTGSSADTKTEDTTQAETGVVYEKSDETQTDTAKTTYSPNTELISKLKADADQRTAQLRSLVEQLISKQGSAYGTASDDDSMWKFLAGGNFTVDAATKAQAQADIADDGYWGVEQTSDRILDFAKALSGGDPDKIEEMKNAFIKGFKQATGSWGKDLPDISQKTYDAVIEKFDKWSEESKNSSTTQDTTQTQA